MRRAHAALFHIPLPAPGPRARRLVARQVPSPLGLGRRLPIRIPWERVQIRAGSVAALCFVLLVTRERIPLVMMVGASACVAASLRIGRGRADERAVWYSLAAAWAGLFVSGLADLGAARVATSSGLTFVELGMVVFATAAATANLGWPEIRRSGDRLLASLIDTVTVVGAVVLWGSAGFPPLNSWTSLVNAPALAHAATVALPVFTGLVAMPQLLGRRRHAALIIGGVASAVVIADLFRGIAVGASAPVNWLAWGCYASGFGSFLWMAMAPRELPDEPVPLLDDLGRPPFHAPGLAGVLALAGTAAGFGGTAIPASALNGLLVSCLTLREVLRWFERRRAQERVQGSLELEARLLALQAEAGASLEPREALRETCHLAEEVLKASAALAWTVEGDNLVLAAIAPARREGLLERKIPLNDPDALAARVYRRHKPEACETGTPGVRHDRFLTTVLDARSLLAAPITLEGKLTGVLVLVRERNEPAFSLADQQKAALIAVQAASALRRYELIEELEAQLKETTLVHRFVVQAMSARNVNDIAWSLLESIRSQFQVERGAVYLVDAVNGASVTPIAHFHGQGHGPLTTIDVADAHARVGLPYGQRLIGYADFYRASDAPFEPGEIAIAERLAQQAAITIQNLRLKEESGKVSTYRELDRLKTELLNAVSHDLRGPLANIKGYAGTLVESLDDMPADEQLAFLQTIESEADRLRDLLEHLLDLTKIEAGVLRVDLQPVNLSRIVKQTLSSVPRSHHQFTVEVPAQLFVMADGRRLRQVLHNLAENAIKYSPNGGEIRLAASALGAEVLVSVSDSGVGIPRHHWDRIFRPYQRAETGNIPGVSGTGLGLAICKGIVEAHGGRIWVESEPGVGSVFSLTVQRAPTPDDLDDPA